MLRINLLHDAQNAAADHPSSPPYLAWAAGVLSLALSGTIAMAGYLLQDDKLQRIEAQAALLSATLHAPPAPAPVVADDPVVVHMPPTPDAIRALAVASERLQHANAYAQTAPSAIATITQTLRLNDVRERSYALHAIRFDGTVFTIEGFAQTPEALPELLDALAQSEALTETRFTTLRIEGDEDAQRRATSRDRTSLPIRFTLHSALALHHGGKD